MTSTTRKPYASLSLDLDDEWTYLKTHGDPSWSDYPSYLSVAVPRILDFLDQEQSLITFFIVAQDAAFEENLDILSELSRRGHDIGNHTFHHDPWLHLYSEAEIDAEIQMAEWHIEKATGVHPTGFRGPGFSFSSTVLRVLAERGYAYDASTFPNILNPLARAYFLWSSDLSREEREKRSGLFGSWKDGLRPNRAYEWKEENRQLIEIPVTTMPLLKIPIHASYILYLATYSEKLALAYFRLALRLCMITGTRPSILLHPLDFIGCDDTTSLSFFPAMDMGYQRKVDLMREIFVLLKKHYSIITMTEFASVIRNEIKVDQKAVA